MQGQQFRRKQRSLVLWVESQPDSRWEKTLSHATLHPYTTSYFPLLSLLWTPTCFQFVQSFFPFCMLFSFEKSAFYVLSALSFTRAGTDNVSVLQDTHTHQQTSWGRGTQAGSFWHGTVGRKRTREHRQAMPSSQRIFWNWVSWFLQSSSPLRLCKTLAAPKPRLIGGRVHAIIRTG